MRDGSAIRSVEPNRQPFDTTHRKPEHHHTGIHCNRNLARYICATNPMYKLNLPTSCNPLRDPYRQAPCEPEQIIRRGSGPTSLFFAQPLNTNYLKAVHTFGMPFGECQLHMTFRMHTTQRETTPLQPATDWILNLTS